MRISDWSSDVCSSDLPARKGRPLTDADVELATGMVIHRDMSAIVLNKLPGLATQGGTKTEQHVDGLLDALKYEAPVRPKLVHRLDKDTSGALLIARTPRAAAYFAKSFRSAERRVGKECGRTCRSRWLPTN